MRLDIEKRLQGQGFTQEDAYNLAITKSKHWKYEDEVRVFVNLEDCWLKHGLYFEPLNESVEITGIVIGPLCNLSLRQIEVALPPGKQLSVVHSRLAFRSFDVVQNKAFKKQVIYGAA